MKQEKKEAQTKTEAEEEDNEALAAEVAMLEELVIAAERAAKEKGQLLTYSKKLEEHIDKLEVLACS
jgi:hypothetical protein